MIESPKLTDRQQQILDLVQSAIERTGAPPTRAEIAAELGFRSANAAEEHLQALARKGVIELIGGTSSPSPCGGCSTPRGDGAAVASGNSPAAFAHGPTQGTSRACVGGTPCSLPHPPGC